MEEFQFGDIVENGWASEDNPQKRGVFIMKDRHYYVCTNMDGDFWEVYITNHKLTAIGSIFEITGKRNINANTSLFQNFSKQRESFSEYLKMILESGEPQPNSVTGSGTPAIRNNSYEVWEELADAFDKLVHHYTLTETLLRKAHDHGFINGWYQSLNINIESSWNEFKKLLKQ